MIAVVAIVIATLPAAAQPWDQAERIDIELSNFLFAPSTLRLRQGRPYRLHFVNRGSGGHNFSAPAFFRSARINPADAGGIEKGAIELGKGQSRDIRLVPSAGSYKLKCTHFMHSTFGMKGRIVVD
jgi:plastocyanin